LNLKKPLKTVDWKILRDLQENARLSYSELGRRAGLTPPAAAERVRRLQESAIISGYRTVVNTAALGLSLMAFIRIAASSGRTCAQLAMLVRDLPEVLECHRVTGDDCYIMRIAVPSVQHLEALLDRLLPYGRLTTSIVLSSPVTYRVIGNADAALKNPRVYGSHARL
jgi:Lrp/AsnC family leucine-responsive transcriptional regulator